MHPPTTPKEVCAFLGLVGYYRKFIKNFVKIAKPLTLLTCQQVKFDWTPTHHEAFLHLKESITQAPILHYPEPNKRYIIYTHTHLWSAAIPGTHWCRISNCLSLTFLETQRKWSMTEQEAYGVYYAIYKMELLSPRSGYHSQE